MPLTPSPYNPIRPTSRCECSSCQSQRQQFGVTITDVSPETWHSIMSRDENRGRVVVSSEAFNGFDPLLITSTQATAGSVNQPENRYTEFGITGSQPDTILTDSNIENLTRVMGTWPSDSKPKKKDSTYKRVKGVNVINMNLKFRIIS